MVYSLRSGSEIIIGEGRDNNYQKVLTTTKLMAK